MYQTFLGHSIELKSVKYEMYLDALLWTLPPSQFLHCEYSLCRSQRRCQCCLHIAQDCPMKNEEYLRINEQYTTNNGTLQLYHRLVYLFIYTLVPYPRHNPTTKFMQCNNKLQMKPINSNYLWYQKSSISFSFYSMWWLLQDQAKITYVHCYFTSKQPYHTKRLQCLSLNDTTLINDRQDVSCHISSLLEP